MQLYHYYRSSASYRVRIALALKGLLWNEMPIHLGNGEHFSSDYSGISPSNLVPTLEDQGCTIGQSLAIMEYLDDAYPGQRLLPDGVADRAFARELALDIACEIHPLNNRRVLVYLEETLQISEGTRNEWYRHWVCEGLKTVEKKLARPEFSAPYCLGGTPTIADCCLVPQIFNAERFHIDLTAFPKVMHVFDNCMKLSAFRDTQPSCFDPVGAN